MTADSLQVTLETDKPAYRAGEPVELILRLTNRSAEAKTLDFSSSQRYDFKIEDSGGAASVWTWSADRMFAQMMGTERLGPGESREYREEFSGTLPPGKYQATGVVTASGPALQATTSFSVR